MENNIQNQDLQQMKEQLALLQHKLSHQEIVSDKLIKSSMKNRMKWIKQYVIIEIFILAPLAIACLTFIKYFAAPYFHISWFYLAFIFVGLAVDIFFDYRINVSAMKDSDFNHDSLNATAVKLAKMKDIRQKQMKWGILFVVIAIVWLLLETWLTVIPSEEARFNLTCFTVGMAVGLPIGVYATISLLRKMQRTNDELIGQINELTQDEDTYTVQ